jgi:hypothetical protein
MIDFWKLFEVRPDFRAICVNNDLTNYSYLQPKVNKVKEAIEAEKEDSRVIETYIPGDILRYVIWTYL